MAAACDHHSTLNLDVEGLKGLHFYSWTEFEHGQIQQYPPRLNDTG